MTIIAVDNHADRLVELVKCLHCVFPKGKIADFTDPMTAVKYNASNPADIVFSDIAIGAEMGFALPEGILEKNKGVKIYFITDTDKDRQVAISQRGCTGFVVRPITADAISQVTKESNNTPSMTIMAVDPYIDRRAELVRLLGLVFPDSKIVDFNDPLLAVKYVINFPVDIVFTEISMRRLDGVQLMEMVSQKYGNARVFFVVETEDEMLDIMEDEVSGFLIRPVSLEAIQSLVLKNL